MDFLPKASSVLEKRSNKNPHPSVDVHLLAMVATMKQRLKDEIRPDWAFIVFWSLLIAFDLVVIIYLWWRFA